MPLVRVDITQGHTDEQLAARSDTMQEVLVEFVAAPKLAKHQIFQQYRPGLIRALDTGLGYPRTDHSVVSQLTPQGRTTAQNKPCTRP